MKRAGMNGKAHIKTITAVTLLIGFVLSVVSIVFFQSVEQPFSTVHKNPIHPTPSIKIPNNQLAAEDMNLQTLSPAYSELFNFHGSEAQFTSIKEGLQYIDRKDTLSCPLPPPMDEAARQTMIEIAKSMLLSLVNNEFTAVHRQFDPELKSRIGVNDIEGAWQSLKAKAGELYQLSSAGTGECNGERYVFMTCIFQNAFLDAKVTFSPKNRVTDFSFEPSLYDAPHSSNTPPKPEPSNWQQIPFYRFQAGDRDVK